MNKPNRSLVLVLLAGLGAINADAAQIRCFIPKNAKQTVASVADDHGSLTTGHLRSPLGDCEIDDRSELTYDYYYGKHLVIRNARCPMGVAGNLVVTASEIKKGVAKFQGHLFFKTPNSSDLQSTDIACTE